MSPNGGWKKQSHVQKNQAKIPSSEMTGLCDRRNQFTKIFPLVCLHFLLIILQKKNLSIFP